MSDPGRKSFYAKTTEWLTPGIFKSRTTKVAESTTNAADTTARETQPDRTKSVTQASADKLGRAKDRIFHGGSSRKAATKTKTRRHWFHRRKRSHIRDSLAGGNSLDTGRPAATL